MMIRSSAASAAAPAVGETAKHQGRPGYQRWKLVMGTIAAIIGMIASPKHQTPSDTDAAGRRYRRRATTIDLKGARLWGEIVRPTHEPRKVTMANQARRRSLVKVRKIRNGPMRRTSKNGGATPRNPATSAVRGPGQHCVDVESH